MHPYTQYNPYLHKCEKLADAWDRGASAGHGIACHNVPELGSVVDTWSEGRVTVDAENIREVHEGICFECEENARCFSPFEFTAAEFNSADEFLSEDLWTAYDEGVAHAIQADVASYDDEDYGT